MKNISTNHLCNNFGGEVSLLSLCFASVLRSLQKLKISLNALGGALSSGLLWPPQVIYRQDCTRELEAQHMISLQKQVAIFRNHVYDWK